MSLSLPNLTLLRLNILLISIFVTLVWPFQAKAEGPVTLSTEPATVNVNVGDPISLKIIMNTNGDSVSAAELHLSYDQTALQGLTLTEGSYLPIILKAGTIGDGSAAITLGANLGAPAIGTGTLATATFKALKSGTTMVSFASNTQTASTGKKGNTISTVLGSSIVVGGGTVTSSPLPAGTATPTLPPPAPSSTPNPIAGRITVNFDDLSGQDYVWNGGYPRGRLDWGQGNWYLSSPWQKLNTKSISFNGPAGISEASFQLLVPAHLESIQIFNGGFLPSRVKLECAGQETREVTISPNVQPVTIQTGWFGSCTNIIVSSSNGWDTNFDNLVLADSNTNPVLTPMPSASAQPTTAPSGEVTINFDDLKFQNKNLKGQYPTELINWGANKWFLSGPWKKFTTKSFSFNKSGVDSRNFKFVSPKILVSLKAYNGGTIASNVRISCEGQPTKQVSIGVDQIVTITTDWNYPCTTVTIRSSNGWNVNFDDLIVR